MKVLIADDHAIFRQGLRVVLGELDPAVEILEAADFGEALTIAKGVPALSLLLADLRMPEMDGFEGLRALRRLLPRVPIMVLSASEEAADLFGALESGASGYLSKSAPAPVILEALRLRQCRTGQGRLCGRARLLCRKQSGAIHQNFYFVDFHLLFSSINK